MNDVEKRMLDNKLARIEKYYTQNALMERLGQQRFAYVPEEMEREFWSLAQNVQNDVSVDDLLDPSRHGMDFYALGVIHGKKIERERRRKSAQNQ